MYYSYYINASDAFYFLEPSVQDYVEYTEGKSTTQANFVNNATSICNNGCFTVALKGNGEDISQYESKDAIAECSLPTQPGSNGILPPIHISGTTILMILVMLREVRKFVSAQSPDRS